MVGQWVTDIDRATVFALADTGSSCGVILCAVLGPLLINRGVAIGVEEGWAWCFYLPALVGTVWSVLWAFLITDSPKDSTWISSTERTWVLKALELEARELKVSR
jgi:ACS family tartrate transporter-like MFS transporter